MGCLSKKLLLIIFSICTFSVGAMTPGLSNSAASTGSLASVLHQTTGTWRGELYYLDYQSGTRYAIPMKVEASLSADEETLIRQLTFTDPENLVFATQLLTLNEQEGSLAEAYFRDNQGDCFDYQIVKVQITDENHWRFEFQNETFDDERKALVLHKYERKGNQLFSEKKVKYLDDSKAKFIVRNGSKLTLMEAGN